MLGTHKIMAFAPTLDANNARPFYEGVLGLLRITSTLAWFDRCLRNAKNKGREEKASPNAETRRSPTSAEKKTEVPESGVSLPRCEQYRRRHELEGHDND